MAGEITASARPFGPGVSIRVQSHAGDFESLAPLLKLRSAVGRAHCAQIGKQGPCGRQRAEDFSHFVAEMDQWRLDGTALKLFAVMIGVFVDPGYRPPVPCGPCFKKVSTPPGISLDKAELALLRNVEKAGIYGIRIWELLNRIADEQNPATRAETRALRLKLWQNLRKLLSRGVVFRRARRWISVYRLPRASVAGQVAATPQDIAVACVQTGCPIRPIVNVNSTRFDRRSGRGIAVHTGDVGRCVRVEHFDIVNDFTRPAVHTNREELFAIFRRGRNPDLISPDDRRGPAEIVNRGFPHDVVRFAPDQRQLLCRGVSVPFRPAQLRPVLPCWSRDSPERQENQRT